MKHTLVPTTWAERGMRLSRVNISIDRKLENRTLEVINHDYSTSRKGQMNVWPMSCFGRV